MPPNVFIEAEGLVKRYGGAQALSGVDLTLEPGEVHALVGENGAGKSTLGKCFAGVVRADEGTLRVDGREVDYRFPRRALEDGIAIVEQELALVPAMSVADNIRLGQRRSRTRMMAGADEVQRLSDEFHLDLDVSESIERLPVAEQQKVEILRALSRKPRLIVMDEPTARLARDQADNLLRIIRRLADGGCAVVFVSHFLDDVLSVSDRVTVMRDGRVVRTTASAEATPDSLVAAMLGRKAELEFPTKAVAHSSKPILEVDRLSDGGRVMNVSFSVAPGEIVGLAGLVGSGRTETARLIFGAERRRGGTISIDGERIGRASVRESMRRGIAYLPESRKDYGLFLNRSCQENMTVSRLGEVSPMGVVSRGRERRAAASLLEQLDVRPADPRLAVGALSGGNQQKVLFGKWLWRKPRILIADEPTRGVDVGAKFAIYELLVRLASEGLAIVLISSEIEELVGLSHRVVVLARGRSIAELGPDEVGEQSILRAAFDSDAAGTAP